MSCTRRADAEVALILARAERTDWIIGAKQPVVSNSFLRAIANDDAVSVLREEGNRRGER